MRSRGSVLIVVLGLLAILAVVGITFVTMSSIDTSTAANFALQAQFDLASDAAVEYVCHALVQDVWEFDTSAAASTTYRQYTGRALTGLPGNEHYDFPQSGTPSATTPDTWLATNWVSSSAPTGATYSFCTASTVTLFNLTNFGGTALGAAGTDYPNNLGIPTGKEVKWNDPANGLWIPDLAFPYETGVIRVSVTVQDHGAMVNLNAHGNVQTDKWEYSSARGVRGYFVSDLAPIFTNLTTLDIGKLVFGDGASVPGRWGDGRGAHTKGPGIKATGETLIQNPFRNGESPYTLDEEFELRRLTGTDATTRLEFFTTGAGLQSTPASCTQTTWQNRLSLTTVGWTAEVRPYPLDATDPTKIMPGSGDPRLKADLNFDDAAVIQAALTDGRVFNPTTSPKTLGQFVANICAFRKRSSKLESFNGYYGARRQPFFTKASAGSSTSAPPQWPLKLEVFNPWPGDQASSDTGGIAWSQWRVVITCKDPQTIGDASAKTKITIIIEEAGTPKWAANRAFVVDKTSTLPGGKLLTIDGTTTNNTFAKEVTEIRLEATVGGPTQGVDNIASSVVSAGWRRKVGVYEEMRDPGAAPSSPTAITVLYVKDLAAGETPGTLSFGTVNPLEILKGDGIPIRFPHSVPDIAEWDPKEEGKGPLPPYAADGKFKAFLRLGDLNQVLCPGGATPETEAAIFWPWIGRVASKSLTYQTVEKEVKFNWDDTNPAGDPAKYSRMNAANVLTTERPWLDSFDNDGDGKKDDEDKGYDADGRFCGPEIRVAGKVNLNTATAKTLEAIDTSLGSGTAIRTAVTNLRGTSNTTPIKSIAQLVAKISAASGTLADAWGPLEKRDLWFTRLSNIATVRSDTFSIYGTVQFVAPPTTAGAAPARIMKTRRFWALVDRSPSLAFSPAATGNKFLHPRIVNFQWMD